MKVSEIIQSFNGLEPISIPDEEVTSLIKHNELECCEQVRLKAIERYSFGWSNPRVCYGSGSDSCRKRHDAILGRTHVVINEKAYRIGDILKELNLTSVSTS